MITAYTLSRLFVFAASGQRVHVEVLKFILVNLVALAQVWVVSVSLAGWLFPLLRFEWYPEFCAHVLGVISPIVTSYYGHKVFTFSAGRSLD